ncbi:MAG: DUF6868 family protein [Sulfurovum sp.]
MFTLQTLTEFLGWASVINISILLISSISLILMRESIMRIHSKMFGLDDTHLSRAYFQYLAQYKIAIFIFNLVPYIALKIMS